MKYKIGFSYNRKSFFSKLIAKFTASKWSHVFLVIEKLDDDYLIVESSAIGGVKFNLLSKYGKNYEVELYDINTNNQNIKSLTPYIGDNYGYSQIIGNVIARTFRLKKNPITKDTVCAEIILLWLEGTRLWKLFKHLSKDLASPEDLYRIIRTSKDFPYSKLNKFFTK